MQSNTSVQITKEKLANWIKSVPNRNAFQVLSSARTIKWNEEILYQFEHEWDWEQLSKNTAIPWTKELVLQYENNLCWDENSAFLAVESIISDVEIASMYIKRNEIDVYKAPLFPWSDIFITQHIMHIKWQILSQSTYIKWDKALLEKFITVLDYDLFNWPLNEADTIEILQKHKNVIDWSKLSACASLPWSESLLFTFEDKWCYQTLIHNIEINNKYSELFEFVKNKVEPLELAESTVAMNEHQFEWLVGHIFYTISKQMTSRPSVRFRANSLMRKLLSPNKIWETLSAVNMSSWTLEFMKKYEDKWHWGEISINESIKWTDQICDYFRNQLEFEPILRNTYGKEEYSLKTLQSIYTGFLENLDTIERINNYPLIQWNEELIELYRDKIDIDALAEFGWIDSKILDAYQYEFDWQKLSQNRQLRINRDTFLAYHQKWNASILNNPHIEFLEEDYLSFQNRFKRQAYYELEQKQPTNLILFTGSLRQKRYLNELYNIPWSIAVFSILKDHFDKNKLASNNMIPWTFDYLILAPKIKEFIGCHFNGVDLSFVDESFLMELY
ncbi:hypothetical protein [Thorsellia anophelis]|uniref:Uncharacterized protein n=1 Tax=Thorsellia anophelis DSM 18579 TaxID=1123402 RepID=A0A1I0FJG6_9GAMM|nr:hypothetical protein [Thorsellia anophelis]SET58489.1 hypothetical protein SAMN02583745_02795 [Thorsellia anophelis DSM 18579]